MPPRTRDSHSDADQQHTFLDVSGSLDCQNFRRERCSPLGFAETRLELRFTVADNEVQKDRRMLVMSGYVEGALARSEKLS